MVKFEVGPIKVQNLPSTAFEDKEPKESYNFIGVPFTKPVNKVDSFKNPYAADETVSFFSNKIIDEISNG